MMDAGIVRLYNLVDTAAQGDMPKLQLVPATDALGNELVYQFEERVVGFNRQYQAKGVEERVDMLIRVWRTPARIGMYAVLTQYESQENVNGDQYRIDNVQNVYDDNNLKVTDLSLYRLEDNYAVLDSTT